MNQPGFLMVDLSKRVRSLSLNRPELRALLEKLEERALAAGDIEAAAFQTPGDPPEVVAEDRRKLKEGFRLYLTVTGVDGAVLNGSIQTVFDSPNSRGGVKSVFFDTSTPLKVVRNYTPRNKCVLFLDFSRPEVFNFTFLPSQETPNESNISVQGIDSTWVHGVYHEFDRFIRDHSSKVQWLHRQSIFDVLLWFAGFPIGFWCCFRASKVVTAISSSPFLQSALYVYLFIGCLFAFRILFHYSRWIWPLVEFRHPRDRALQHKLVWIGLAGSLLASLVYDLIKLL